MDLSFIELMIPNVAKYFGIDPATALLVFGMIVSICNIAGRLIPDDKTGWVGKLRDLCKAIGLYTPNRVTSGVSVNDVASAVVGVADKKLDDLVPELAKQSDALIPEVIADGPVLDAPIPAFPGLVNREDEDEDVQDPYHRG